MQWIPSIRQYLTCIQGCITLKRTFVTPLQCKNDIHLMDLATQYAKNATTIKIINACRLYLQIKLLSNITTSQGKSVQDTTLCRIKSMTSTPTTLYPHQSDPNKKAWSILQAFLLTTVCTSHLTLKTKLGQWLHTGTNMGNYDMPHDSHTHHTLTA